MRVTVTKEIAKEVKEAIRKKRGFLSVTLWFYGKDNRIRINVSDYDRGIEMSFTQEGGVEGVDNIVLPLHPYDMALDMLLKGTCILSEFRNNRPGLIITNDKGTRYQEECVIVKSAKTGKEIKIQNFVTCEGAGKYGMLKYERSV